VSDTSKTPRFVSVPCRIDRLATLDDSTTLAISSEPDGIDKLPDTSSDPASLPLSVTLTDTPAPIQATSVASGARPADQSAAVPHVPSVGPTQVSVHPQATAGKPSSASTSRVASQETLQQLGTLPDVNELHSR
jgi:hypothetical protein